MAGGVMSVPEQEQETKALYPSGPTCSLPAEAALAPQSLLDARAAEPAVPVESQRTAQSCSPLEEGGVAVPSLPRSCSQDAGMAAGPLAELDRTLEKAVSSGDVPGLAYAILKDGKVVKASALGVADLETGKPWRFDTLCRLYSMTKSVAVCGLMTLVEEGLVSLSDSICKYLPAFARQKLRVVPDDSVVSAEGQQAAPSCDITIKHLLTHCSGLSYGPPVGDDPTCATEEAYQPLIARVDRGAIASLEQWCGELAELPLRFQPGERWEYSYGIDVLGRVMEIVSGQPLDVFLQERVLTPLGMRDTAFVLPKEKLGRLASFYRRLEDGRLECVDSATRSRWLGSQQVLSAGGTVGSVAGGLVSTLNDFARLCSMLQRGGELDGVRVLREETVRLMGENLLPEMTGRVESWCLETAGLGFGILGSVATAHAESNWYDVPGEIGWGGLAGTAWAADRREGLVVLSFCQVMYELWIDEEVRKAARQALGYSAPVTPPATLLPEAAAVELQVAAAPAPPPSQEAPVGSVTALAAALAAPAVAAAAELASELAAPQPPQEGAPKRALEFVGESTPKRSRPESVRTQCSTEKLKLESAWEPKFGLDAPLLGDGITVK